MTLRKSKGGPSGYPNGLAELAGIFCPKCDRMKIRGGRVMLREVAPEIFDEAKSQDFELEDKLAFGFRCSTVGCDFWAAAELRVFDASGVWDQALIQRVLDDFHRDRVVQGPFLGEARLDAIDKLICEEADLTRARLVTDEATGQAMHVKLHALYDLRAEIVRLRNRLDRVRGEVTDHEQG